ncbi:RNA-binding protein FUS-like [Tenebrio molitor]|uniref:RNA-binding protein FUS-like n=1 Tax=Tenebrio molitor TaxID=7067 RepID=UPI003624984B
MRKVMVKQFSKPIRFAKLLWEALYETHEGQDLSAYCFNKVDKLIAPQLKIPETFLVDAVIGEITDEGIARTAKGQEQSQSRHPHRQYSPPSARPKKEPSNPPPRKADNDRNVTVKVELKQAPPNDNTDSKSSYAEGSNQCNPYPQQNFSYQGPPQPPQGSYYHGQAQVPYYGPPLGPTYTSPQGPQYGPSQSPYYGTNQYCGPPHTYYQGPPLNQYHGPPYGQQSQRGFYQTSAKGYNQLFRGQNHSSRGNNQPSRGYNQWSRGHNQFSRGYNHSSNRGRQNYNKRGGWNKRGNSKPRDDKDKKSEKEEDSDSD